VGRARSVTLSWPSSRHQALSIALPQPRDTASATLYSLDTNEPYGQCDRALNGQLVEAACKNSSRQPLWRLTTTSTSTLSSRIWSSAPTALQHRPGHSPKCSRTPKTDSSHPCRSTSDARPGRPPIPAPHELTTLGSLRDHKKPRPFSELSRIYSKDTPDRAPRTTSGRLWPTPSNCHTETLKTSPSPMRYNNNRIFPWRVSHD